jgi:hypothetical protein
VFDAIEEAFNHVAQFVLDFVVATPDFDISRLSGGMN